MLEPYRIDVMHMLNVDSPQSFVGQVLQVDDVDETLKPFVPSGYVCTEQFTANEFGAADKFGSRLIAVYRKITMHQTSIC